MEDIHQWNGKIIALIERLKIDHPELMKFIDEMPVSIPDDSNPQITIRKLEEYYNSLMDLENLKILK